MHVHADTMIVLYYFAHLSPLSLTSIQTKMMYHLSLVKHHTFNSSCTEVVP